MGVEPTDLAPASIGSNSETPVLRLSPEDNVVIAMRPLEEGEVIASEGVTLAGPIPAGHKLATAHVAEGGAVKRYGQTIGFAKSDIEPGQHVHVHNIQVGEFNREHHFGATMKRLAPFAQPATFNGIVRQDGTVATRNYIAVISTVNCSATAVKGIAAAFAGKDALKDYPNVDGVVALTHGTGCGLNIDGEAMDVLRRVMLGYARHANVGGVLFIGLGCEVNQVNALINAADIKDRKIVFGTSIQDEGGTAKCIERGIEAVQAMLPEVNQVTRQPVPASHIIVGLQCGGSDGYSGISANPSLGAAVDLLVRNGGTAILSETPEIYGAEHLLTSRAVSNEVGEKLLKRIAWWEDYTSRNDGQMNNNPSPGNKAGGLTTILEKSLGAIAKSGSAPLEDVYEYAEPVTAKGLVFMDSPGYDPVSATGQVAAGANIICFTTGRGSAYGCIPSPSIKIASNSPLYRRMTDDMDVNAGAVLDGDREIAQVGQEIFDLILAVAGGQHTKSEALGYGQNEFAPWILGATM